MVTPAAAMAVVRAARPVFRCAHDGIAFAANAAFLADGYSLCAVGPAALTAPLPAGTGWSSTFPFNKSLKLLQIAFCILLIYPPVVLVGHDDTFPVPRVGFYSHSGEAGGSMHVGPNDPRFFPTNPSTPFGDLGSVPPGGRYDPIGPPDVPGFEPSRFVRHSRQSSHSGGSTHPDLEFFQQGPDFF